MTSVLVPLRKPFLQLYVDLSRSKWDLAFVVALLLFELSICIGIIYFIPYTEIDWKAYMEQVAQFQAGERNYYNIRGGTGPLVYPAGFLYLYSWLHFFTFTFGSSNTSAIFKGQQIFIAIYMIQASIVFFIYSIVARQYHTNLGVSLSKKNDSKEDDHHNIRIIANSVWSWRIAMLLCCLSKRIHSIYMLRLFNDGPAMTLFYLSLLLFIYNKWKFGCITYSLAVSIKMNILLFAPGLLLLLLQSQSSLLGTIQCLAICAMVQLIVGWPFLISYPVAYVRKSFELDRVFMFKWTVNWKFLEEDLFVSKKLSLVLLVLHLTFLVIFAIKWLRASKSQTGRYFYLLKTATTSSTNTAEANLTAEYITCTLFLSNMIGIIFARTLHYQFYSWYFHTIPMLIWQTNMRPWLGRLVIVALIEYSFNVFPASPKSSMALQIAHLAILGQLVFFGSTPRIVARKNTTTVTA